MARYAYIKNGDAVEQVQRLVPLHDEGPTSGPDAFIYSFLCSVEGSSILMLSRHNRNSRIKINELEAYVYKINGSLVQKIILRMISVLKILLQLMLFKPEKILVGTVGGPLWISFIVSRLYNIPLVHSRHNKVYLEKENWYKHVSSMIDLWVIRKLPAIITHGPYLRDQLIRAGIAPQKIYEFDVSFDDIIKTADENRLNCKDTELKEGNIILYMGRIEEDKGVIDLLEATSDILRKDRDSLLVYAGEGSHKNILENEIEKKNLNDSVKVLGYVPHDCLVDLIKKSKLIVTPTKGSFLEGRCMSAMEGLVMGVPVVAPKFGPFPYLIEDGINGFLYETDSISDMKRKINSIFQDKELYEKLRCGALSTSKSIRRPLLTFGEAVEYAFSG
jgi:glycosyltransferase involved in cell wall biosynthesis